MATKPKRTPYWWRVIARARKRGNFTDDEFAKAASWTTCACGKQDARIERTGKYGTGPPRDNELAYYGNHFAKAVYNDDFEEATELLTAIERRSAELLGGTP
jgi:hypothetical protein